MRDASSPPDDPTQDLALVIARRRERIRQMHASNLIEGVDVGPEALATLLARAGEPISDRAFSDREAARIMAEYTRPPCEGAGPA